MYKDKKIIVVLPAYNAAKTLAATVADIPSEVDEIILVDDKSSDETASLARELGLHVFERNKNGGYGANQKDCYRLALERGADIVAMLHPDYQYDPKMLKYFFELIGDGRFDLVLGSRIRSRREALEGGMPLYKYISNRFLSFVENILSGQNLSEWHTGMRAYSREVLERINFKDNSDDFVFDSQVLFQSIQAGFSIGELPVPVRYFAEASSINFKRSLKYGFLTLACALKYFIKNAFKASKNKKRSA